MYTPEKFQTEKNGHTVTVDERPFFSYGFSCASVRVDGERIEVFSKGGGTLDAYEEWRKNRWIYVLHPIVIARLAAPPKKEKA